MASRATLIVTMLLTSAVAADRPALTWRELPSLPVGLGGQYVGVVDDRLIVAGGSYWTASQWEGGRKIWSDVIYSLGRGDQQWMRVGTLPEAVGYGATVSIAGSIVLLGGQTSDAVSPRVYRLTLRSRKVQVVRLADLPGPMAMMGSTLVGDRIYFAGGQATSAPARALKSFITVRVSALDGGSSSWKELPSWPGPSTFLAQMTSIGNAIYLVGGADLVSVSGQPPVRSFLKDAYEYSQQSGWRKIADYPHPVQAGVAASFNDMPLIFGGSDGLLAAFEAVVKEDHPGFSTLVWGFDRPAGQWRPVGRMPLSLVTTGIVRWGDEWIIAGGEDRPGHRSPRVIAVKIAKNL